MYIITYTITVNGKSAKEYQSYTTLKLAEKDYQEITTVKYHTIKFYNIKMYKAKKIK